MKCSAPVESTGQAGSIRRRKSRLNPRLPGLHAPGASPPIPRNICPSIVHQEHRYALFRRSPSPHVRGTPVWASLCTTSTRSIPACAGNTLELFQIRVLNAVHPRMCGEHVYDDAYCWGGDGPSPHVRGTRLVSCQPRPLRPVHPRMCGEHFSANFSRDSVRGPSPHVRGTPRPFSAHAFDDRSIPACAGNTETIKIQDVHVTVHPRMCGEHRPAASNACSIFGPSPHVRGTLYADNLGG